MLENMLKVAVALLYTCWWVIPVALMVWMAMIVRDRADMNHGDRWPYDFEPPFNMDDEGSV